MAHPVTGGLTIVDSIPPQTTTQMANLKGVFVDYLNVLPYEHQARAWQMIESFAVHWQRTGTIAAYHCFGFCAEVVTAAKVFERHLKSLPGPDAVNAELAALKSRRPQNLQSLPFIQADSVPLGDLMRTQPTRQYQRIFRSFEHQQAVKEEYDRLNDKRRAAAVPDCQDFPNEIDGQHKLVEELFDAIIDCSEAEEQRRLIVKKSKKRKASDFEEEANHNEANNNGAKDNEARQWVDNTYVKRISTATDVEIQFVAWNLLRRTRDAQNGVVGIGPWATNWKYNPFGSFRERFDHVKDVCRRSKAVVVSMMTADDIFTKRLAAGPLKEIGQKRQNKHTNLLRDMQNKAALHCQRKGWLTTDLQGHMFDAEGARIDPSPPHLPTTESVDGPVDSENIPPTLPQGIGQVPVHVNPMVYNGHTPGNTSELQGQQMFSAAPTRVPGPVTRSNLAIPTPSFEGYSLGSGGATFSAASNEGYRERGSSVKAHDPVQARTYPYCPNVGQHDVYHLDTKQEAADGDDRWHPEVPENSIDG